VSFVGFSLGSVISFDLLTCHSESFYVPSSLSRSKAEPNDSAETAELKVQIRNLEAKVAQAKMRAAEEELKLDFLVDTYFMFGSPVGIFMTLRGDIIHSDGAKGLYPKCRQMYK